MLDSNIVSKLSRETLPSERLSSSELKQVILHFLPTEGFILAEIKEDISTPEEKEQAELKPLTARYLSQLCVKLWQKGNELKSEKPEQALQCYNTILSIDPNCIPALLSRASIFEESKKYFEAYNTYQAILRIHPDNKNAKDGLTEVLKEVFSSVAILNHFKQTKQVSLGTQPEQKSLSVSPLSPDNTPESLLMALYGTVQKYISPPNFLKQDDKDRARQFTKVLADLAMDSDLNMGLIAKKISDFLKVNAGLTVESSFYNHLSITLRGNEAFMAYLRQYREFSKQNTLKTSEFITLLRNGNFPTTIKQDNSTEQGLCESGDQYFKTFLDQSEKKILFNVMESRLGNISYTLKNSSLSRSIAIKKAEESYKEAYQKNPQNVNANNGLGNTSLATEQYDAALEHYNNVLKIEPDHIQALIGKAHAYFYKKELSNAQKAYDEVLKKDPKCRSILMFRAYAYLSSSDDKTTDPVSFFEKLLEDEPGNIEALLGKALTYELRSKKEMAFEIYSSLLKIDPANKEALLGWAETYTTDDYQPSDEEKKDTILERYTSLLNIEPKDKDTLTAIIKLSQIHPSVVNNLVQKADSLFSTGQYQSAIELYNLTLDLYKRNEVNKLLNDADKINIHIALGKAYANEKNYDAAIKEFGIVLDKYIPRDHLLYGPHLHQNILTDFGNALIAWTEEGTKEKNIITEYRKEAYKRYTEALRLNPDNLEALLGIVRFNPYLNDSKLRLELYIQKYSNNTDANNTDANNTDALVALAKFHHRKSEHTEALSYYNRILVNNPLHIEALIGKADISRKIGDSQPDNSENHYEEGINCCQKALEIDPHHSEALTILADLQSRMGLYYEAYENYSDPIKKKNVLCASGQCSCHTDRIHQSRKKSEWATIVMELMNTVSFFIPDNDKETSEEKKFLEILQDVLKNHPANADAILWPIVKFLRKVPEEILANKSFSLIINKIQQIPEFRCAVVNYVTTYKGKIINSREFLELLKHAYSAEAMLEKHATKKGIPKVIINNLYETITQKYLSKTHAGAEGRERAKRVIEVLADLLMQPEFNTDLLLYKLVELVQSERKIPPTGPNSLYTLISNILLQSETFKKSLKNQDRYKNMSLESIGQMQPAALIKALKEFDLKKITVDSRSHLEEKAASAVPTSFSSSSTNTRVTLWFQPEPPRPESSNHPTSQPSAFDVEHPSKSLAGQAEHKDSSARFFSENNSSAKAPTVESSAQNPLPKPVRSNFAMNGDH